MESERYYSRLQTFREKLLSYVENILKCYGNELLLRLEDYNILQDENNCIESSTAIGYIIEEFVVSKLMLYTQDHKPQNGDYRIDRLGKSTTVSSFDCFSQIGTTKVLINVKSEKHNSSNNAVAAINCLYKDYVCNDPSVEKAYLTIKLKYDYRKSERDNERKIYIKRLDSYYLEEIDFRDEHRQDHRNWSQNLNLNSGRLQISNKFREKHTKDIKNISYQSTCEILERIYVENEQMSSKKRDS